MTETISSSSSSSSSQSTTASSCSSPTPLSRLERLPPDLSTLVLSHLSVQELAHSLSLVSKTMCRACRAPALWRIKFQARWPHAKSSSSSYDDDRNDDHEGDEDMGVAFGSHHQRQDGCNSWYMSYQRAYRHPHDLWITHWNCVYPNDALSPGRCCIPPPLHATSSNQKQMQPCGDDDNDADSSSLSCYCPTCRYEDRQHPHKTTSVFKTAWRREIQFQRQQVEQQQQQQQVEQHQQQQQHLEDPVAMAQRHVRQDHNDTSSVMKLPMTPATTTPAKRMALSTQYFLAKACRRLYQEFGDDRNDDEEEEEEEEESRMMELFASDHNDDHDNEVLLSSSTNDHVAARLAFEKAATFHRHISHEQYRTDQLCFLKDVLFFNVTSCSMEDWTRPGDVEQYRLRYDVYGRPVSSHEDDSDDEEEEEDPVAAAAAAIHTRPTTATVTNYCEYETAHHSWHVAHFSNPDLCRPISFRIFIQRPDCFAVYPAEGYLSPGESCAVVFSVRPMGSLLSEAFEALNVHREGVDPFLGNVYTEEAHLPYAPFCIRYMYAPMTPCVPPNYRSRVENAVSTTATPTVPWVAHPPAYATPTSSPTNKQHMIDHLWDHVATEADIRTIYLSAHVVGQSYPFLEFQRATLTPFRVRQGRCNDDEYHGVARRNDRHQVEDEPLVLVAPELQSKDPQAFQVLHNMRFEVEMSPAAEAYRTEPPCDRCGQRWGLRLEELGHAYVVGRMECLAHAARRRATIRNMAVCVRQVQDVLTEHEEILDKQGTLERILQLMYIIHTVLQQYKTFPLITAHQLAMLLKMECKVDELCVRVNSTFTRHAALGYSRDKAWIPWRHSGVYPYLTCTDSIFNPSRNLRDVTSWKEEPNYLEAFRHLAHSPGRYCLGPREDPNHLGETLSSEKSRYYRRQLGCVTDVFMDDQVCAIECAVCMLHDPRSLLVHGIYDRVFTASVSRRPKLPLDVLSFLGDANDCDAIVPEGGGCLVTSAFNGEYPMWNQVMARRTAYYELQDALDLGSLGIRDESSLFQSVSVRRYIRNIPAPGRGRFGLSKEGSHDLIKSDRAIIIIPWDPQDSFGGELFPTISNPSAQDGAQLLHPENGHGVHAHPIAVLNPEGPRIHNLLGLLSAHLGWTVEESQGAGLVFVDRRILIATQMVSVSLMIAPILGSLLARCTRWIPSKPITYHLEDMPFSLDNEMRFLTERECGYLAGMVVFAWLFLVRRTERKIGRDFFRVMIEHVSPEPQDWYAKQSFFARAGMQFVNWCQRRWDASCPLFLQRLVFTPKWNRRTESDLIDHIASWRSKDFREHRNEFKAVAGRGKMLYDQICAADGAESSAFKLIVSGIVASGSFCASSPHFVLNLLTVFCCSIGLGLSLSLHSMEVGRSQFHVAQRTGSILRRYSLVTMIIFSFLIGQLVGSSGGILFLAEFVVTSMSLLLGGAGTISASAIESWGCFFCLSSAAFWGYLCARVALMDGILHKRGGFSSTLLCASIVVALGLFVALYSFWNWETAPALMIVLPRIGVGRKIQRIARKLQ